MQKFEDAERAKKKQRKSTSSSPAPNAVGASGGKFPFHAELSLKRLATKVQVIAVYQLLNNVVVVSIVIIRKFVKRSSTENSRVPNTVKLSYNAHGYNERKKPSFWSLITGLLLK